MAEVNCQGSRANDQLLWLATEERHVFSAFIVLSPILFVVRVNLDIAEHVAFATGATSQQSPQIKLKNNKIKKGKKGITFRRVIDFGFHGSVKTFWKCKKYNKENYKNRL